MNKIYVFKKLKYSYQKRVQELIIVICESWVSRYRKYITLSHGPWLSRSLWFVFGNSFLTEEMSCKHHGGLRTRELSQTLWQFYVVHKIQKLTYTEEFDILQQCNLMNMMTYPLASAIDSLENSKNTCPCWSLDNLR